MTVETDVCAACGRDIVAVKHMGPPVNLDYVFKHVSRRANRDHHAIPENYPEGEDDDK